MTKRSPWTDNTHSYWTGKCVSSSSSVQFGQQSSMDKVTNTSASHVNKQHSAKQKQYISRCFTMRLKTINFTFYGV